MLGHLVISTHFLPLWCTMSIKIGSQVWFYDLLLMHFWLSKLLIDFDELIESYSGEHMAFAIWDTLEFYGLKGKVPSSFIIILESRLILTIFLLLIVIISQTMTIFWNHWRGCRWGKVIILMPKRATFAVCLIPSTWQHWRQVTKWFCM